MPKDNGSAMEMPLIPTSSVNNQKQKAFIFNIASLTGALVHFGFIFLFMYLEQNALAWLNVASVFLWLATFWPNRQQNYGASVTIMSLEIMVHAYFASQIIGSAAGFQYYLWPMALLVMAMPVLPIISSTIIGLLNMLAFGFFTVYFDHQLPALASSYDALNSLNLLFASAPFVLIAAIARFIFENQYVKISQLAEKDELTQLFNRRFAQRMLDYYFKRQKVNAKPFCIALVDVDNFKQINDELGHSAGDDALIKISHYLCDALRENDICSRWGGEEFLFILPDAGIETIQQRLEDICKKMPTQVRITDWETPISCSFGLIQIKPDECPEDAFRRVDKLLYQAKNNGRCQVASDHLYDLPCC